MDHVFLNHVTREPFLLMSLDDTSNLLFLLKQNKKQDVQIQYVDELSAVTVYTDDVESDPFSQSLWLILIKF